MKNRNLLYLLVTMLCSQTLFSCNSARQYEFTNRSQGYHSEKTMVKTAPVELTQVAEIANEEPTATAETLTAGTASAIAPLAAKPLVDLRESGKVEDLKTVKAVSEPEKFQISREQKKELKGVLKKLKKQKVKGNTETARPTVDIIELIFAIFLPPIGVLLHDGGLSTRFWISLLLTLLLFFPGMIYAILVVTDTI